MALLKRVRLATTDLYVLLRQSVPFSQRTLCCICAAFAFLLTSNLEAKAAPAPQCLNCGDVGHMVGMWEGMAITAWSASFFLYVPVFLQMYF